MDTEITVLIPAFNEERYIADTLYGVKSAGIANRVLVVDDCSTDNTSSIAQDAGAEVIRRISNRGKGNALNTGLKSIISGVVVFIDGDVGRSAKEFYKLVEPILAGDADMVIGVLPPSTVKGGFGLVKKTSERLILKSTGKRLNGCLSGQRAATRETLSAVGEIPDGFAAEVGINIKALNLGYRVLEVPVKMSHRESGRNLEGFLHRGIQFYDILKFYSRKGRIKGRW